MVYTAGIFLFNNKDEIIVVHPTNAPMNKWSIPKGLVDEKETIVEAAKRELFEETNVNLENLKLLFLKTGDNVMYSNKKKTLCPIFCKVLIDTDLLELKCNSLVDGQNFYENDQILWMPVDKAIKVIHETQVKALTGFNPLSIL
jgi:ADP-ribose pyrophosphatase YjhB (NUDIX family)